MVEKRGKTSLPLTLLKARRVYSLHTLQNIVNYYNVLLFRILYNIISIIHWNLKKYLENSLILFKL